jgi:hypothetical protein
MAMSAPRYIGNLITTPPGSIRSSPLTPPPTNQKLASVVPCLLEIIRSLKYGRYSSREEPWQAFHVCANEYEEFEQLVREDGFVQDKLR